MPKVQKIGFLHLNEREISSEVGPFNWVLLSSYVPPVRHGINLLNPASIVAAAVGNSVEAASRLSESERLSAIVEALKPIEFSPRLELNSAVMRSFEKRQLFISLIEDEFASQKARNDWDFSDVPKEFDSLLDIDIKYCGYYLEKRKGGFVPCVYFDATLLGTAEGGYRIGSYYAQADAWPSGGNRHYITTSPNLVVKTLNEFEERKDVVREEMRSLLSTMAEILAEDVDRTVRGLPRLS